MEKLPRPLLGMFRSKKTPPPLPQSFTDAAANPAPVAYAHQSGVTAASQPSTEPFAAQGHVADEPQRASWFQTREAVDSGVAPSELAPTTASDATLPGVQTVPTLPSDGSMYSAIAEANQQLALRTAAHMNTVIAVVLEQRDAALARLATLSHEREVERARAAAEHDRFVTDLLQEHSSKQVELERQIKALRHAAERQRALGAMATIQPSVPVVISEQGNGVEGQLREQLADLRRLLEAAYVEVDDLKTVVPRLEEERDTAIREADDSRIQLYSEIEAARDEGTALQVQLDEAQRQLEEVRDQARDEAHGWSERLSETERELDERRAEVSRLRERMDAMVTEVKFSRPPPPATSDELMRARDEAQQLRKELIDTKRQLSRVSREFAVAKMQRPGARNPQVAGAAGIAGVAGVGQPAINSKTPVPGLPIAVPRPRMLTPVGLGEHDEAETASKLVVVAPESAVPDSDTSS
jgi:hypothetical protein